MSPAYDDDPTITDDDELLRRIRPELIVPDQKSASGRRLSSAAFDDSSDGTPCSVNVRREALAPETILAQEKHGGYSIASVTAHVPRSLKQTVLHWPDDEEPGHAYIAG